MVVLLYFFLVYQMRYIGILYRDHESDIYVNLVVHGRVMRSRQPGPQEHIQSSPMEKFAEDASGCEGARLPVAEHPQSLRLQSDQSRDVCWHTEKARHMRSAIWISFCTVLWILLFNGIFEGKLLLGMHRICDADDTLAGAVWIL